MAHVVTMFRAPGENFNFINEGPNPVYTRSRTLLEAAQTFAQYSGYPPQLDFTFYDADGKFMRYLETNEGRMVREALTPPEEIGPYLKFQR